MGIFSCFRAYIIFNRYGSIQHTFFIIVFISKRKNYANANNFSDNKKKLAKFFASLNDYFDFHLFLLLFHSLWGVPNSIIGHWLSDSPDTNDSCQIPSSQFFFHQKQIIESKKYQRPKPDGSSIRQNNQRHYNDYIEVRFKYCHNNKSSVSWTLKKHTQRHRESHIFIRTHSVRVS